MKQSQQRKLSERKQDLAARQEQIAAAAAEVEALRQRVAGQTVNKADMNRMIMERCVGGAGVGGLLQTAPCFVARLQYWAVGAWTRSRCHAAADRNTW